MQDHEETEKLLSKIEVTSSFASPSNPTGVSHFETENLLSAVNTSFASPTRPARYSNFTRGSSPARSSPNGLPQRVNLERINNSCFSFWYATGLRLSNARKWLGIQEMDSEDLETVSNYFGESVVVSFMSSCCFCSLPISLLAISYSSKVDGLLLRGKYDLAVNYARTARFLTLVSLLISSILYLLMLIFVFTLVVPI